MAQRSRFASAASALAVAAMLTGCATSKGPTIVSSGFGGPVKGSDVGLATRAMAALNSNDVAGAVTLAERAVEKTPDDAGFRMLLGNAYFAAGRFASAEAAYKDSLSIYSNQPQVVLKLALAEVAQGKGSEAVAFLNAAKDSLDPANYGLAVALAGQPQEAIDILQNAARQPNADSKVRQNLALAYALSGDWDQARLIASQDIPANQIDGLIQQWMQFAKPAHNSDQVASLTGVKPAASDPGQPVRLALIKGGSHLAIAAPAPQSAPQPQVAVAAPVAPPVAVAQAAPPPQVVETPAPPPPPVDSARVAAVAPQVDQPAPAVIAAAAAAAPEAPAAFAAFAPKFAPPKPKPAPVRRAAAKPRPAAARFAGKGPVMQLGSYRSPEYVSAAWTQLTKKYPALRAYLPLRARFDSPKGTFYRLSVQGFATQREAQARCQLLKSRGGACFVRGAAGDAPVEIASR